MRTPLQAMLWELWRTSRFELLLRVGGQTGFVFLMHSVTSDLTETETYVFRGIAITLLTVTSVFSLTWMSELESDSSKSGFSFRLGFTRPVSTFGLVVVPMLFTVLAALLCFLVPAVVFSVLFGVSMPLAGLAALIATTVVCFVASTWSPTTAYGKIIALSAMSIAGAMAFAALHRWRADPDPILLAMGKPEYFDLEWFVYAACLAVSALAFFVTVCSVDRQRHGDRWELVLRNRFKRGSSHASRAVTSPENAGVFADDTRAATVPFTSPFAAQVWYEMRRFGKNLLLLGMILPLMLLVFMSAVLWFEPDWEGVPVISLLALVICPFVYQLFGASGAIGLRHKQGATKFSAFDATISMANDQLIAVKLLVIAAGSLVGWLWMGFAVAIHTTIAGNWHIWARIRELVSEAAGDVPVYWWAAGLASAALMYISSSSVFLAFGLWLPLYKERFGMLFLAGYFQVFLAGWDRAHGWPLQYFWLAEGYALSVSILAGCVFALRKALLAGYLGKRLFGCAFCLWVIYFTSTVVLYIKLAPGFPISIPLVVVALGVSLLLVPLASTAIAPLALASHRHA